MKYPTREKVQQVRKMYPTGCRVELVEMGPDPYSKLQPGDQGTVKCVDDIGTVGLRLRAGHGLRRGCYLPGGQKERCHPLNTTR